MGREKGGGGREGRVSEEGVGRGGWKEEEEVSYFAVG